MTTVLTRNGGRSHCVGLCNPFGPRGVRPPGVTLAVLVALFGAYAIVDGVLAIIAGVRAAERHERWWSPVLKGSPGCRRVLTFVWPALNRIGLTLLDRCVGDRDGVLEMWRRFTSIAPTASGF